MQIDVPVIFISAFLVFFMGGFFFTYYAILWFENEARKEDEELGKLLKLPERKGRAFSKEKEAEQELAERKKVA
jgi:hypothetical protein